jgi:8-oxo-dGTP pyrophosphatase MutT (NUDIX family)
MQPLTRGNIRLAATVLLLKNGPGGIEVFMMKRPGRGDFPDLHVFPGGKVDEQDFLPEHIDGLDDKRANELLGVSGGGLRYWVTAIRECFEECGVLLARRDGELFTPSGEAELARFDGYRHELIDGSLSMAEFCRCEGLTLAADRLFYFSHWLTPAVVPRRFDTRFFITRMPEAQEAIAHQWETAGSEWVRPERALELRERGDWSMIAPTVTTLKSIARLDSLDAIEAEVRAERHLPALTAALEREGMQPLR